MLPTPFRERRGSSSGHRRLVGHCTWTEGACFGPSWPSLLAFVIFSALALFFLKPFPYLIGINYFFFKEKNLDRVESVNGWRTSGYWKVSCGRGVDFIRLVIRLVFNYRKWGTFIWGIVLANRTYGELYPIPHSLIMK